MNRWLLSFGSLTAIAAGAIAALAVAGVFNGGSNTNTEAGDGEGSPLAGVCVEGVPDCVDTVVDGGDEELDDAGDPAGACLEGSETCDDTPEPLPGDLDPDEPVTSEPITSGDGIDLGECSTVHNLPACEERAVEASTADLAERLGIDAAGISVGDTAFSEWSNACLDAAGPDEMCAEVITPGFVVVLEAGADQYEYHTDTAGNVRLAE